MGKRFKKIVGKNKVTTKLSYAFDANLHPEVALTDVLEGGEDILTFFGAFLDQMSMDIGSREDLTREDKQAYWQGVRHLENRCETVLEYRHNSMHIVFKPKGNKRMKLFKNLREHAIAMELRR